MTYVVRHTFSPEYDIQRNWSGWIGQDWDTLEDAYAELASYSGDLYQMQEQHPEMSDEEIIATLMEDEAYDVRWNEVYEKYQNVHHDGLSCWLLDAETEEEAVEITRDQEFDWSGTGWQTIGNVRVVCQITDTAWLFECEDVTTEDF